MGKITDSAFEAFAGKRPFRTLWYCIGSVALVLVVVGQFVAHETGLQVLGHALDGLGLPPSSSAAVTAFEHWFETRGGWLPDTITLCLVGALTSLVCVDSDLVDEVPTGPAGSSFCVLALLSQSTAGVNVGWVLGLTALLVVWWAVAHKREKGISGSIKYGVIIAFIDVISLLAVIPILIASVFFRPDALRDQ